jgi:nickel transport protein
MTMTKVKHPGIIFAAFFLFLALAASAYAHATVLWCYVENNHVYVEAFFMGGAKVQNGTIFVVDKNGEKLLEGKTNKEGLFNFEPPVQDDMTIVLKVDSGHGADFKLTKQDFLDAAQEASGGN